MVKLIQKNHGVKEVLNFFITYKDIFVPPLETRVNIHEYAEKISENATQFWLELNGKKIGFLACYFNNPSKEFAYFTILGVAKEHEGKGYGRLLMTNAIDYAKKENFKSIRFEVRTTNTRALNLYKDLGAEIDYVKNGGYHVSIKLAH